MAFNAKLNIGGKEFDVLSCDYELEREVDAKGRPSSNIYGGKINITIESTADTSILENMVSQYKPGSGSVVFRKADEEAKMKELAWENGYVIRFKEAIDVVGAKPMALSFTVSAQTIKIGNAQFEQNWPKA